MAHAINQIQENVAPPAASIKPATDMQTILASITNLQVLAPAIAVKPQTKMKQVLVLLTHKADNENGGRCRRNNNNCTHTQKVGNT